MRLKIKKSGSYKFSNKYLDLIAKSEVYDVAEKTPISFAGNLSSKLKNEVYLKREDMPVSYTHLTLPTIYSV